MSVGLLHPLPQSVPTNRWAWRLLVLFIGCLVLYLASNQSYDLLTDDEARYAESGRRMVESGDWIIPEFNGYPRYQKPIFFYWLQALAQALFGSTLWATRLPTALAGTGVVLMTAALGKALWGPRAGFWTGVALATCAAPRRVPAPGRFSTTIGWPSTGLRLLATMRPSVSVRAPAGKGTTSLSGWSG